MAEGKKTGSKRTAKAAPAPAVAVAASNPARNAGKTVAAIATSPAADAPLAVSRRVEAPEPAVAEPVVAATVAVDTEAAAVPAAANGHDAAAAISPEERAAMVADAAYYRAERRQFAPGFEQEDWFDAEREIEQLLSQRGTA
ncbi:DUF2934 domain-containing protein [Blastochloris viridis]|nr:DUF2934 domain-containing protein [Blastochloris viridis]ALK07926.1 hypothetical protein BVIR_109 [Blastochloris viridis]CUU43848.1 hypothetical protein BVIRIDIS_28750 [Blastochloris viridis]